MNEWWIIEGRRRGGRVRSPVKAAAARENGKLGGRPSRARAETQLRKQLGLSASEPIDYQKILQGLDSALRHVQEASDARKLADAQEQHRIEAVTAAAKEIVEKGYKMLAFQYHPDLAQSVPTGKMQALNAAIIWLRSTVGSQTEEKQEDEED